MITFERVAIDKKKIKELVVSDTDVSMSYAVKVAPSLLNRVPS